MNKENRTDISFNKLTDTSASIINERRYKGLEEMNDVTEVERAKVLIKLDIPIQIGFFVLEYAKLLLLRFYFDFLSVFIPFHKFSFIQCDSMYLSLFEPNLFATVPPEKMRQSMHKYEQWFAIEYCQEHKQSFFDCMFSATDWVA